MPASPSLLRSVEASLKAAQLADSDRAAAVLARQYAEQIDSHKDDPKLHAWALRWIGPLLLQCLTELQLTPKSRAVVVKKDEKKDDSSPRAKLYELRNANRLGGTSPVDPSAKAADS